MGRKEQKLHLGLEGDASVCVLKARREPKEAENTVQAVFPTQLPRPEAEPGKCYLS